MALIYVFTDWFERLKAQSMDIIAPFYFVADIPAQAGEWGENRVVSKTTLLQENNALRSQNLILTQKLQKNVSLEAENFRLRQLLNASEAIVDRVEIAEIIGVLPDPQVHKVILNRGSEHGVHQGQALIDAFGLMGQIVDVGTRYAVALLITDTTHALPVQVNRNGMRLVAEGIGDLYELKLRHVSNTSDIRVGDLLISSGLGQRFPAGYPVAEVTKVDIDEGQPFANVSAKPMAKLNRSRHVLLVFETETAG